MTFKSSMLLCSSLLLLSAATPITKVHASYDLDNKPSTKAAKKKVSNQKLTNQTQLTQTNNQPEPQLGSPVTTSAGATNPVAANANNYFNDYGYSHFTRYNLEHMQDQINSGKQQAIGNLDSKKISNIPSAIDTRPGVKGQKLNVWDSWPLQDAAGNEVTYKGYHLTFALAGNPKKDYTLNSGQKIQDAHIYLFYQKIKDETKGVKSWKNAGMVFKNATEGAKDPSETLKSQLAQWSGETILTKDNQIRLFYTSFNGSNNADWQTLATAQIKIKTTKNKVSIQHAKNADHKIIAQADGINYQTISQAKNDNYDENIFRDPHYFEYKGKKYLTFVANSTDFNGPEGDSALYNTAYLGGNTAFQNAQQDLMVPTENNPWHLPGADYNAVVGVAELNNDYSLKTMKSPILGFNTVTDEFERPDLFEHNGKWYLFGITRGYKLATPSVKNTDSFMLGFVADSPFGPFKPLNKNGLIIRNHKPWKSRHYSYSFYVLNNNNKGNRFVLTNYTTNAKLKVGHQTFGPSMVLNIKGDKATVEKKVLNQGQLVLK